MKAGNSMTIEVNTPTGPRRFQMIATDGAAPNPIPASYGEGGATIIRYDRAGGIAGVQAALAGALGGGFNVSLVGNTLRVVDAGGGNAARAPRFRQRLWSTRVLSCSSSRTTAERPRPTLARSRASIRSAGASRDASLSMPPCCLIPRCWLSTAVRLAP
jgi:hypothetical protein